MNQALNFYVLRTKQWTKQTKSLPLHSMWKRQKINRKSKICGTADGSRAHKERTMKEEEEWAWRGFAVLRRAAKESLSWHFSTNRQLMREWATGNRERDLQAERRASANPLKQELAYTFQDEQRTSMTRAEWGRENSSWGLGISRRLEEEPGRRFIGF